LSSWAPFPPSFCTHHTQNENVLQWRLAIWWSLGRTKIFGPLQPVLEKKLCFIVPEKSVKIVYSNIETLKTQGIWASNF
jgi:hypothetical protein